MRSGPSPEMKRGLLPSSATLKTSVAVLNASSRQVPYANTPWLSRLPPNTAQGQHAKATVARCARSIPVPYQATVAKAALLVVRVKVPLSEYLCALSGCMYAGRVRTVRNKGRCWACLPATDRYSG